MVAVGFLSRYMNGVLTYNRIKNVLSVLLNKTFPSVKNGDVCIVVIYIMQENNRKMCRKMLLCRLRQRE